MANYGVPLLNVTVGTTTFFSAGCVYCNVAAGLARRIELYEIEVGHSGPLASSDGQVIWDVSRFGATATLAGSNVVPNLLDGADTSPCATFYNGVTAELTYTAAAFGLGLKRWALNQRGFNRWRTLDDGDRLVVPAVAMNGMGIRAYSAVYTGTLQGSLSFTER